MNDKLGELTGEPNDLLTHLLYIICKWALFFGSDQRPVSGELVAYKVRRAQSPNSPLVAVDCADLCAAHRWFLFFLNLITTLCARVFCRGTQRSASAPQSSPLVLMCLFETRSDIPQADLELCETKNDLECKILLPSSPSAEITGVHPNTQQLAFLTELVVSTTHCEPAF